MSQQQLGVIVYILTALAVVLVVLTRLRRRQVSCGADNSNPAARAGAELDLSPDESKPAGKRELATLQVKAIAGNYWYYLYLHFWYDCR